VLLTAIQRGEGPAPSPWRLVTDGNRSRNSLHVITSGRQYIPGTGWHAVITIKKKLL
jgi:hypothetical protein